VITLCTHRTAHWLGGLDPIPDFNPLAQMTSGVHFSLFASPEFGNPRFPLSDVPLSDIAAQVQAGQLDAAPVRVFTFDEIKAAQNLAETGEAGGKVVVVLD
jgi:NADPH:quinone reductase-like Zn-dependent oxidoreductase